MDLSSIKKHTDKTEGFLHDAEGQLLYNLAKKCTGRGVIVEIGSWKGKSTIWLAKGSLEGKKVKIYAIDPHTGSKEHRKKTEKINTFTEFKKNIRNARIEKIVSPIVKTSEKAVQHFNKPIELLFIDGDHSYKMVKKDFRMWSPKLIDKGIIAFHDTTNWPGPKKVVSEYIFNSRYFANINFVRSISYATKVKKNLLRDRIRNKYVLLVKDFYSMTSTLPFPDFIKRLGGKIISLIK